MNDVAERRVDAECRSSLSQALKVVDRQGRELERLGFLVEAAKVLNSTLDLFELLERILRMTTSQTGADRATLFLIDAERGELWSWIAQGLERKEIRLPMGKGLAGWVAQAGEPVNLADAYSDPRFDSAFDGLHGYRTQSILVMPVKARDGRIVGVLELLNKAGGTFNEADIACLDGISSHAAIALENARLYRESRERQRLEHELALARSIQMSLLPDAPPSLPGFDFAVRYDACSHVGGDYYDFIPIDAQALLFVIADVEGKGVSSALIAAGVQATLRALTHHVHAIEDIAFHLSESIRTSARGGRYLTLFLGMLDGRSRAIHYVNAGHLPPLLLRNGSSIPLEEGGTVMGLFPRSRYKRGIHRFQPGDRLLAFTDGITEARDAGDREFGTDRLLASAVRLSDRSARDLVDGICRDVDEHSAGNTGPSGDDRLLLALCAL
jgi:serine phosphatase RsbU (regulator of sigma subunit)